MAQLFVRGALLGLTLVLAACGGPRGAALTSELVGLTVDETGRAVDPEGRFAVYNVSSQNLALLSQWPTVGANNQSWLRRQPGSRNQVIATGDQLSVTVWDAEENSLLTTQGQNLAQLAAVRVSESGNINLPFVGNVHLAGLTVDAARARIEDMYAQTIPSAQVQLAVEAGRGNAVNLVSGVGTPGIYPMPDQDVSLLTMLALGGGVSAQLVNPQIKLMRGQNVYGISMSRLMSDPALDTTVRGGDRIVAESDSRTFLSLGATGTQARHAFVSDQMSALDALSVIGGVAADRADINGIVILRQYPSRAVKADGSGPPNSRMIFALDLTSADGLFAAGEFRIMNGDVVYATEDALIGTRNTLSIFTSVLSTARQF